MVPAPSFETRVLRTAAGAVRLVVDLDDRDRRRFASAVAPAIVAVERSLAHGVLAPRASPAGPAPLGLARARWDRAVASAIVRPDAVVLRSDVRRCYRSITPGAVDAGLRRAGVGVDDRARVEAFLRTVRRAGIDGLPVGPDPSAVLANAVLAIADDAVRAEGVAHVRWVDDVVFVGHRRAVDRAFAAWRRSLTDLGLTPHEGKTVASWTSWAAARTSPCAVGGVP